MDCEVLGKIGSTTQIFHERSKWYYRRYKIRNLLRSSHQWKGAYSDSTSFCHWVLRDLADGGNGSNAKLNKTVCWVFFLLFVLLCFRGVCKKCPFSWPLLLCPRPMGIKHPQKLRKMWHFRISVVSLCSRLFNMLINLSKFIFFWDRFMGGLNFFNFFIFLIL